MPTDSNRTKNVHLKISNSITTHDYIMASFATVSVFVSFCVIYIIGAISCKIHQARILREQSAQDEIERAQAEINLPLPQTSGFQEVN